MKSLWTVSATFSLAACAQTEVSENVAVNEPAPVAVANEANAAESPAVAPEPGTAPAKPVSACLIQDGEKLRVAAVKALGTEPFWAAEVEGRCVTYKTPEDQKGTRIWTRVESGPQGPAWNGALRGRQFQLYVKPSTGCSDGMSDKTYPMDAVLRVEGETRRGCAEPL
jgi:uncharacterized membrane protein